MVDQALKVTSYVRFSFPHFVSGSYSLISKRLEKKWKLQINNSNFQNLFRNNLFQISQVLFNICRFAIYKGLCQGSLKFLLYVPVISRGLFFAKSTEKRSATSSSSGCNRLKVQHSLLFTWRYYSALHSTTTRSLYRTDTRL